MSFTEIICQERALNTLFRTYAGQRIPHALIFSGLEGVGKFQTAAAWARLLLCRAPVDTGTQAQPGFEACGACASRRAWEAGAHPDFVHIYKELRQFTADGKGKAAPVEMPIDVIREFLISKVATRPTLSQRKVFVVSEAEKLNTASQNALLKVLEEPPAFCCIIMLCTRLEALLPTTKSRAHIIRFGPIEEAAIAEILTARGLDRARAGYFASLAQGSLGQARIWADLEAAGADLYGTRTFVLERLCALVLPDAPALAEQCLDKARQIRDVWERLDTETSRTDLNRRSLKLVMRMMIAVLDDVLKISLGVRAGAGHADHPLRVQAWADRLTPEAATYKIEDCFEAMRWIEAGVNERLIFERLLLRMAASGIMTRL